MIKYEKMLNLITDQVKANQRNHIRYYFHAIM